MSFKSYLIVFFAIVLVVAGAIFGFCVAVDPYGVNHTRPIRGLNVIKPEMDAYLALSKPYRVRALQPQAIALGTSRTEDGLDPNHPGWGAHPVYNFALNGSTFPQTWAFFEHARSVSKLRQVVVGLDFDAFNIYKGGAGNFDDAILAKPGVPDRFAWAQQSKLNFAWQTLLSSFHTVRAQSAGGAYFPPLDNGQGNWQHFEHAREAHHGHHALFVASEALYLNDWYLPMPRRLYRFDNGHGVSTLDYFSQMVNAARASHIDLRLFISPSHARQWETIRLLGLWPQYEQWKRELTSIIATDARLHPGEKPFELIDFANYNDITGETVPASMDATTQMRWYWESSHYKKELGDLVLDRVLDYRNSSRVQPEGFGVSLTPRNIEAHLAGIRIAQQVYRRTHQADVTELEHLLTPVPANQREISGSIPNKK